MRKAFTLIELLVVMAIIAILAAILLPVITGVKAAVEQGSATRALGQMHIAASLYMSDSDDRYMPAMYVGDGGHWQFWFGQHVEGTEYDLQRGLLLPYSKKILKDNTHFARPHLGDGSGFGYNYGSIGGDWHHTNDYSGWPNSKGMAMSSMIDNPSETVVFATTAFYNAGWQGGDDQYYDFGFFDPPSGWNGNPNLHFRHIQRPNVDVVNEEVVSEGHAVMAFADGSVRPVKQRQVKEHWFYRDGKEQ